MQTRTMMAALLLFAVSASASAMMKVKTANSKSTGVANVAKRELRRPPGPWKA